MPKMMNPTHQPRSARSHRSRVVTRLASTINETSSRPRSEAAVVKNVLSEPDRVRRRGLPRSRRSQLREALRSACAGEVSTPRFCP